MVTCHRIGYREKYTPPPPLSLLHSRVYLCPDHKDSTRFVAHLRFDGLRRNYQGKTPVLARKWQ